MNPKYAPLFQPYTLNNGVAIPNRLVVAPLTHWASHPDGSISEGERRFLQSHGEGFGLFISAATLVAAGGKSFAGEPEALGEKDLPSLCEVASILKSHGAKAILQLHHGGHNIEPALSPKAALLAPSDSPVTGSRTAKNVRVRGMDEAQVRGMITAFAQAASLGLRAGFDGVEIHGANGYLIQQFVSAQSNRRNDHWGGSPEKRLNFPLAVIDAIDAVRREQRRPDFIVGYRFSPEEAGENGMTMVDAFALIDALVQKPLQYLHVSLWDFYRKARRGADTDCSRIQLLHERIAGRLPLIGVGNLFTADQILAAYQTGWAEFIALGKTVMINPALVALIRSGREAEIVTELDPEKADRYGIPDTLWQQCLMGLSYLPPLKGDGNWQPMDI